MNTCPPGSAKALTVLGSASRVNLKFVAVWIRAALFGASFLSRPASSRSPIARDHRLGGSRSRDGPPCICDHFRGGLQAHRHFVGLVAESDPFFLAGDLVLVARVAVVGNQREGGNDRGDDQPRFEAGALRAAAPKTRVLRSRAR